MSFQTRLLVLLSACCCLLPLTSIVSAQTVTDYMYVTDYGNMALNSGGQNLLRYSFTATTVGGVTTMSSPTADPSPGMSGANFIAGLEGITGTADSVLAATTTGIVRYNAIDGVSSTINVTNGGSPYTFDEAAGMATDGTYLYVAEQGHNVIDKIQLSTGAIVAQYSLSGAHDVALAPDGLLYAAGYLGNAGIIVINPTTMTQVGSVPLIANGADGTGTISRPTGLSFTGTATNYTLYAQSNVQAQNTDKIGIFTITNSLGTTSGTPALGTTTFITPGNLSFTFGNNIGPDGNLYIADLGDGSGTSMEGVTDGVYEYNITSDTTGTYLAGYNQTGSSIPSPATTANDGVLVAPKYVVFNTDFTTNLDQGITPEPGAVALFASLGVAFIAVRRRRKPDRLL